MAVTLGGSIVNRMVSLGGPIVKMISLLRQVAFGQLQTKNELEFNTRTFQAYQSVATSTHLERTGHGRTHDVLHSVIDGISYPVKILLYIRFTLLDTSRNGAAANTVGWLYHYTFVVRDAEHRSAGEKREWYGWNAAFCLEQW